MSTLDRSRVGRAFKLGRLGTRVAFQQGRRLLGGQAGMHRAIADALRRELGELKGLPMKIGQLLSYMDGLVPEEHQAVYREVLGELRTHSSPVAPDAWRGVFVEELGDTPEALFDAFEESPMATASIGQVHRAVFEGAPVCVKIQYPGVADANASDLRNLDGLMAVMRRLMPSVDTRQMIEDFRERLREECDYAQEADYQRRFAAIYAGDPTILVPRVVDARSTARVLTTRFVEGVPFGAVVSGGAPLERDALGVTLWRFAFGTLLRHGLFHADPHPGNLVCRADGTARLAVLDYGCVQPIGDDARADLRRVVEAALEGEAVGPPTVRALGLTDLDDRTADVIAGLAEKVLSPIRPPQPFRFAPDFGAAIARDVVEAKRSLALRYLGGRGRFVAEREGVMFVVRNLFGLASLWSALGCAGDYAAVTRDLLAR